MTKNQRVLITGGSRGIGFECAKALVHAGVRVWIGGRSQKALEQALESLKAIDPSRARASRLDVSDPSSVEKVFSQIRKDWAGLDGVLHTAAVLGPTGNFWELPAEGAKEALDVDVMGSFLIAREATRLWMNKKPEGRGKLVLFSGGGAAYGYPKFLPYACAKVAVVRMCETIAMEWEAASLPLDCNVIAPGANETEMLRAVRAAGGEVRTTVPFSKPIELCQWLLSTSSDGLSGRFIHVNDNYKSWQTSKLSESAFKLRRVET